MKKIITISAFIFAAGSCKKEDAPVTKTWRCVFAVNKATMKREYVGCCLYAPTMSDEIAAKLKNYYTGAQESFTTQDSASCKNF